MYICVCHGVTDLHIDQAVSDGATCMRDLREHLKVATQCGRCATCARDQLHSSMRQCGKSHHRTSPVKHAPGQQATVTALTQKVTETVVHPVADALQAAGA